MPRLGEILVSVGALSPGTLNRALLMQRSTGGRLGTVLLEHNLVTEDTLARALSKQSGHEYAYWSAVESAPKEILSFVPAKIAIRYGVIPFDRQGRVLKVAMRDPNDLAAADELSFVTGRKIEPYVLAELRVGEALERFYGERRTPRYRSLSERLARGTVAAPPPPPPPPPPFLYGNAPASSSSQTPSRPISSVWHAASSATHDAEAEIDIATWRPEPSAGHPLAPASGRAEKPEPLEIDYAPEEAEILPPPTPPPPVLVPISLDEAARRMREADSREDIADAAVEHLAGLGFDRFALFIARRDDVIGWHAQGEGVSRSSVRSMRIPYSEPSLFLNAKLSLTFFQGSLPPLPAHANLIAALGKAPDHCGLLPVILKKRVVAFIFVESGQPAIPPKKVEDLKALASAMADGFGRLILLRRGRAVPS